MNKKFKFYSVIGISTFMVITWAAIFFSHTVEQQINYYWQVGMGLSALYFSIIGIMTAAKWNWLKSGVGRGVFFISLGTLMWSIGQLGWSYYLFTDPSTQSPPSHLLDIVDISAIPLWFTGVLMLSKATGARYGLRKVKGQILVVVVSIIMISLSYYFLVVVARGGTAYFAQPFWKEFFDLGYSVGDAVIATIAIVIFALSWKVLGGRFKLPISIILAGFILLYFADFAFSYMDGRGEYYNGDVVDLLYMLTIAAFGLGVNMLDPSNLHSVKPPSPVPIDHTALPLEQPAALTVPVPVSSVPPESSTLTKESL